MTTSGQTPGTTDLASRVFLDFLDLEATPQGRKAADDYMWVEARRFGWLVLRGDLLTEERVRGAKTARRKSSTRYSQLAYARETTLGYMHCSMNKIIIDFDLVMQYSEFLTEKGEVMEAELLLDEAREKDPKSVGLNWTLVNLLSFNKQPQNVVKCLTVAISNVVGANKIDLS